MFPRYLFVWIVDRWHALHSTIGISTVIMSGDTPAHLPNGWVESMKRREHKGLITLPPRFAKGQRVEVTGGLFVGAKALYQGMSSHQREIVILEALGVRVELASGLLR
jgi:transcriptional antiterminator RfaH